MMMRLLASLVTSAFEVEQVGGRGHDVLIARIGAHFGLQRPLEQAHFRGKELLVGVEEFRRLERLSTSGAKAAITASSIVPRISPSVPSRLRWVCMDLAALRRALRVQLAVRRGQRTEGKGGVFTRTGFWR